MAKNDTKIRRVTAKDSKPAKTAKPTVSKYAAKVSGVETAKKPLPAWLQVVAIPFVAIWRVLKFIFKPLSPVGRYFKSAWSELKLVRWPTRRETWKMTSAVIIFSVAFAVLIILLDSLFNWFLKTTLGN